VILSKLKIISISLISMAFAACGGSSSSDSSLSQTQQIFAAATGALNSIYSGFIAFSTITCDDGEPTSSVEGDPQFAGEVAYCTLNENTKSQDSIQGSYFIVSAILCVVEQLIFFNYAIKATEHNNVMISENDSCFGPGYDNLSDPVISFHLKDS